ncbi:MAG: FtsX-like permease family protein, partial [Acidobacteria bacterium]|nr:FtsX-like permease family protein [Acidobacteriota bacterium]
EQPRVMAVTPVLFLFNVTGGTENLIYGIDIDSFNRVSRGCVFHDGGYFEDPFDVMVDDIYAKAKNIEVGQMIPLVNHEFRVSGIVEHGQGSRIFIPLATAQDLTGAKDKAAIFYVRLTDSAYTDMVETRFQEMLPRHEIRPIKEYMDLMTSNNLPALNSFLVVMVMVAMSLGFLVIFLSLYTTIMERTREIGILKSLGASKRYIMTIVLRETAFMCEAGIVAGWAGTVMAKQMINEFFPQIAVHLSVEWALWAALLAMTGGLLGGIYPAVRAAQADPVDALAYE